MPSDLKEKLEVGRYIFRDNDCQVTIDKGSCGHYSVFITGLIGLTGMHYTSFEDLLNCPFDLNKFTYSKFDDNQILDIVPLD